MLELLRVMILTLVLSIFLSPGTMLEAAPEFMPVQDIQIGMTGIAKTVVTGTEIETFGIRVLGILKGKGPSGDLILVKTYGDVIDRTGGIAQGMSGSPVYIDGKLVGAIAYGWSMSDHTIGMVTPIQDMIKLWDYPRTSSHFLSNQDSYDKAVPLKTPLMVSGFGQESLKRLTDQLSPYGLVPMETGDMPAGVNPGPIKPGSAIGVQLVRGDISMGALGTVTYLEGNRLVAFGHPFLKRGASNYFMTNAYVFTTVKGLENSFKVGATGQLVGTISQDRGTGVAGIIAEYPFLVPFEVTVKDQSLQKTNTLCFQVVQDEEIAPVLGATSVFNAIEKTSDRLGSGTAKVSFEITGKNFPGDMVIKRDNLFFSPSNIGEVAVAEVYEALALLTSNSYGSVDILDVKVNIEVDAERRIASILSARTLNSTAKPGETVDVAVTLKPYRGQNFTKIVPFSIPKTQQPGNMTLEVRGGGMIPLSQLLLKKQGIDVDALRGDPNKNRPFGDVLRDFMQRNRNNEIVIEPLEQPDLGDPTKPKAAPKKVTKSEKTPAKEADSHSGEVQPQAAAPAKSAVATDYLIDSDTQINLTIVK